jgi:hypothetical protein
MLDVTDVLTLMAEGKPLPQERFDIVPDHVTDMILETEADILNSVLRALAEGSDPVARATSHVEALSEQYGWYPACGTLAYAMAHRFGVDDMPDPSLLPDDAGVLLKGFALAVSFEGQDEGVWTIPFAMFASLEEEDARTFAACSVCCAAYKMMQEMKAS